MAGHVDVRYTSERCYIQGQKLNIWGEERLYKILIVEDDETIAGGLKNHLGKWNYQAECMTDFRSTIFSKKTILWNNERGTRQLEIFWNRRRRLKYYCNL